MNPFTLHTGDSIEVLKKYPANHFDSCVTDPPYGIRFMGKAWDSFDINQRGSQRDSYAVGEKRALTGRTKTGFGNSIEAGKYNTDLNANRQFQEWTRQWAEQVYRVLKPGAHLVVFCSPRTYHRMVSGVEDAGFEIRDTLMWVFASGFPKSHNVSKALDAKAGAIREVVGKREHPTLKDKSKVHRENTQNHGDNTTDDEWDITEPFTDLAKQFDGWGTALKPAYEPILLARKPLDGTVAENFAKWGVGGINIDRCRILGEPWKWGYQTDIKGGNYKNSNGKAIATNVTSDDLGRWPANFIHDGSEEVDQFFPLSKGQQGDVSGSEPSEPSEPTKEIYGKFKNRVPGKKRNETLSSAGRFFYVPKTSRQDRNEGCEHLQSKPMIWSSGTQNPGSFQSPNTDRSSPNNHPTVKPTELMRYLVRLVTPTGAHCLDLFCGSGSTGKAAILENCLFTGIDMEPEHIEISRLRCEHAYSQASAKLLL